jgi:tetratricopeptide (TPR) repeat protein
LVEGFPLGIELAAVWARALPLGAIASEMAQNMDFLESRSSDVAERHKSIRATFDYSWRLLTQDEQAALCKLSVFRGGFRREAAKLVAGVSLPVLASLLDKSLLYVTAEGRYFRHALLYQYMQEKLAENNDLEHHAQGEHGLYYLRFLQRCLEDIRGSNPKETFALMEEDFENLKAAWQWAASQGRSQLIKTTTEALMRFLDARARFQDGIDLFGEALARLSERLSESDSDHQAARGTLLVFQGKFYERQDQHDRAEKLTLEALSLLRPLGELEPVIWGLGTLGAVAGSRGHHQQDLRYQEEALSEARTLGSERLMAVTFGWLAIAEVNLGHYLEAKQSYREAIHLFNKLGNRIGALYNLNALAELTLNLGQLDEAKTLLLEGLEQARAADVPALLPELMLSLSGCYFKLGLYDEAVTCCTEGLELLKDQKHSACETAFHMTLADIAVARRDYREAKRHLTRALSEAWSSQKLPLVIETLIHWAEYLSAQEKTALARGLLHLASQHPTTTALGREHARKLLSDHAASEGLGEELLLEDVVKGLLYS